MSAPQNAPRPFRLPPPRLPSGSFHWNIPDTTDADLPMVSDSQVILLPTGNRQAMVGAHKGRAMPSFGALLFTTVLTAVVTAGVMSFVSPATVAGTRAWVEQLMIPPSPAAAVRTYTVVAGDSLSRIAQRELGDPALWRLLYDTNRQRLASPSELEIGAVLELPSP